MANLEQAARLRALLAPPEQAARVLALDHWMARGVALNARPAVAGGRKTSGLPPPHLSAQDIVWLEGSLQEPSGFNSAGEPVALNFATGELDTRQLRHPDGVILDIGTHVLAMLRETLHASGSDTALSLSLRVAKDRLGHDIALGIRALPRGGASAGNHGHYPAQYLAQQIRGSRGRAKGNADRTAGRANNYLRSRP